MKALALALLVAFPALADELPQTDAPVWQPVPGGYFVNEPGNKKLNDSLANFQFELARLQAENTSLRKDFTALESRPLLTVKAAGILIGIGLAVGAAVAIPLTLAAAKR